MTSLSVLICTYNRPQLLAGSLAALLECGGERPDQVVVVNGGDERADAAVRLFQSRSSVPVELVKTSNINLAASRNVGLPYCQSEIVAMTDDDAEVFPDWVTQIKRAHREHPEAGAVGGPVMGAAPASLVSRIADLATFPHWNEPCYVRTLPGVNISYKREVIEQVGPQDEALFRGEDVDYNWRVQQLGYQIYFDPAIRVSHHHRSTLGGFLRQHHMYGRAYYLVRRKWPEMYCVYPHQLRRPRDLVRSVNFLLAALYEPMLVAARLHSLADRLPAYPILVLNQISWRAGMVIEKLMQL